MYGSMKANIRICSAALGLTLFGLTGCETVVETEPAVTTTQTTETTEVRRSTPSTVTETRVIRED
jgi:hypothetical protein